MVESRIREILCLEKDCFLTIEQVLINQLCELAELRAENKLLKEFLKVNQEKK